MVVDEAAATGPNPMWIAAEESKGVHPLNNGD
jgi:hypothetical protein